MVAARGSSIALSDSQSQRQSHSQSLSLGKPEPAYMANLAWVRPWPVPGISSGTDEGRSAGEPLAEVAVVWELSWSGVLGARRRQQSWDAWTPRKIVDGGR